MTRHIGSQARDTLEESGYKVYGRCYGGVILQDSDGELELWTPRDDSAGYVVEIDGVGHEFVAGWAPGVEQAS